MNGKCLVVCPEYKGRKNGNGKQGDKIQMTQYHTGKRLAKYVPDYVVFDLETTGTDCLRDQIVEISAVKVREKTVTDTFSSLVIFAGSFWFNEKPVSFKKWDQQ